MEAEKSKRGYAKKGTVTHKAHVVWYKGDDYMYFVHGNTMAAARGQIYRRHKFVRGYTNLRSKRFHALDDQIITYEALQKLGYTLKNKEKLKFLAPICTCDFCLGGENDQKTG